MIHLDAKKNVREILAKHPELSATFRKFHIPISCWGPKVALSLSVEAAAKRYHVNLETLIKYLEIVLNQSKQD